MSERVSDERYVSVEEAAWRLGVHPGTLYKRLNWSQGDWIKVDRRWRIHLGALLRRIEEEEAWHERVKETHVPVPAEPPVPVDTRQEPDWEALPEWMPGRTVTDILGCTSANVSVLGRSGKIARKEDMRQVPGDGHGKHAARGAWVRWWYSREDVRREWHLQEARAYRRAMRGRWFGIWGPRDRADRLPEAWQDLVNTTQAAEYLGVSRRHVSVLCALGELPAVQKLPGRGGSPLLIPRAALERLSRRPGRCYHQALRHTQRGGLDDAYAAAAAELGPEERGTRAERMERDAACREAARAKRRALAYDYDQEGSRAYDLREQGFEPEEHRVVELGLGYRQWSPPATPEAPIECRPVDRPFGQREIDHGEFYSSSQVARLMGVTTSSVHRMRRQGVLQAYYLKKHIRENPTGHWWFFFRKDAVEELLAATEKRLREMLKRKKERRAKGG